MYINENKFKTNYITINFIEEISEGFVLERELLAYLLPLATNKYNSIKLLNIRLEELYNTKLHISTELVGRFHVLKIGISFIKEKLIGDIKSEILELLSEFMSPQCFDSSLLEIAQNELKLDVKELHNSKMAYAMARVMEMYADDEFKVTSLWTEEEIDKITIRDLETYYQRILANNVRCVYNMGDKINTDIFEVNVAKLKSSYCQPTYSEQNVVIETEDLQQAKLVMACNVDLNKKERVVMRVLNSMLGEGMYSLLFTEVREKHGLAYAIHSIYNPRINSLFIRAGISNLKAQKAYDVINKQIKYLQNGEFSDELVIMAKKNLYSRFNSILDTQGGIARLYFLADIDNKNYSKEEFFAEIAEVSHQDIIDVAQKIKINLVYVLSGDKNEKIIL